MKNLKATRILGLVSAVALALSAAGCSLIGDKIGEAAGKKIGEKIVEEATGAKVDVDEDGASISIEDGDGSLAVKTGEFVADWPTDLTYPSDYSILTSSRSEESDSLTMMTLVSTDEPYDSVVGNLRAAYEANSQFKLRDEPSEIDLGSMMTTTMVFDGSQYDLMLLISDTDDPEIPTSVQYLVTIDK